MIVIIVSCQNLLSIKWASFSNEEKVEVFWKLMIEKNKYVSKTKLTKNVCFNKININFT